MGGLEMVSQRGGACEISAILLWMTNGLRYI
jgi:hypothetical protein